MQYWQKKGPPDVSLHKQTKDELSVPLIEKFREPLRSLERLIFLKCQVNSEGLKPREPEKISPDGDICKTNCGGAGIRRAPSLIFKPMHNIRQRTKRSFHTHFLPHSSPVLSLETWRSMGLNTFDSHKRTLIAALKAQRQKPFF